MSKYDSHYKVRGKQLYHPTRVSYAAQVMKALSFIIALLIIAIGAGLIDLSATLPSIAGLFPF